MKTVSLLVVSLALAASTVSQEETNFDQENGRELLIEQCYDEILERYLVERFPNAFIKVFKRIMTSVGSIPIKLHEVHLKGKGILYFMNGKADFDFIERDTFELVNNRKFIYTFKVPKIECIFDYSYVSTLGVEEGKVFLHIIDSTLTFSSSAQMNGDDCTVDTPTLQLNRESKESKVKHQVEFYQDEVHNKMVEKVIVPHISQYLPNILEMVQSRITDVMTDVWVLAQREAEPLVDLPKVTRPQRFCLILTKVDSLISPKDPVCDRFV